MWEIDSFTFWRLEIWKWKVEGVQRSYLGDGTTLPHPASGGCWWPFVSCGCLSAISVSKVTCPLLRVFPPLPPIGTLGIGSNRAIEDHLNQETLNWIPSEKTPCSREVTFAGWRWRWRFLVRCHSTRYQRSKGFWILSDTEFVSFYDIMASPVKALKGERISDPLLAFPPVQKGLSPSSRAAAPNRLSIETLAKLKA